jgi:peptidyl-prolyl cis-trans isomerase C
MKRTTLLFVILAVVVCTSQVVTAMGKPDDVAVFVNGEPISTWEIGLLVPQIQNSMEALGLDPNSGDLIRRAVQRAIDSLLLVQEARSLGIEPNEERVKEKMQALAAGAGGRGALETELIASGVTYEQLQQTVVRSDLVQTLVEERIAAEINVTDEEVEAFRQENPELFMREDKIHSRHILFLVDRDADRDEREAVRRKAVVAHARAVSGENFAALAVELSEGPNAARGGDLGFTARGQMMEAFDEAVWALEAGEISEVVETPVGFHVIKVEEIVTGEEIPVEEARPLVVDLLRQERRGAAIATHLAELRARAEIAEPEL